MEERRREEHVRLGTMGMEELHLFHHHTIILSSTIQQPTAFAIHSLRSFQELPCRILFPTLEEITSRLLFLRPMLLDNSILVL